MNLQRILLSATLVAMTAGLSSAGTVTYTNTSGNQTTDYTYSLALPKFNATLGTLTGVTIYLNATETVSTLTLTNSAASGETFTFTASSGINNSTNSANGTDVFANETLQQMNTGSISLGAKGSGTCAVGTPNSGCSSVSYTPPNIVVSNAAGCCGTVGTGGAGTTGVVLHGTNLASYIGTGNFTLGGLTQATTGFSGGGGNVTYTQVTTADFTVEVDYTYSTSSTPEPASILLTGMGLLGLGLFRKR